MNDIIHADHGAAFLIERDNQRGLGKPWEVYRLGPQTCDPVLHGGENEGLRRQFWLSSHKWKFEAEQARVVAIEKWNRLGGSPNKIDGPAYNRRAKS